MKWQMSLPLWVWAMLAITHLLGMGWALHERNWYFADTDRYQQMALNVVEHHEAFARPWNGAKPQGQQVQEFTIRPPGYPLVVALLGGLGSKPVMLLMVQNVLSLLNIGAILSWWKKRVRPTQWQWMGGIVLVLSFPSQIIYANAMMSEMLLQTAVLVLTGCLSAFMMGGKPRYFGASCVALVAALLIKPVFYPLATGIAVLGTVVAYRYKDYRLAIIGAGPLLAVFLYMSWNMQRTGFFHFSSIAEINLLHYNAAGLVRLTEGADREDQWVSQVLRQANAEPTFASRQSTIRRLSMAELAKHPVVYAKQHVRGMGVFFLDPGRFDISQFFKLTTLPGGGLLSHSQAGSLWSALGRMPLAVLCLLLTVALANAARLVLAVRGFTTLSSGAFEKRGRWVAVGIILYVSVLTGPLGAARFMVPVWPLLLALSLAGSSAKRIPITRRLRDANE